MLRLWLSARPCARLSFRPTIILPRSVHPYTLSLGQSRIAWQHSTSSTRHLSSSLARQKVGGVNESKNDEAGESNGNQPRRSGVLARLLQSSLQPQKDSAGGVRKLVSLMKPEGKSLMIAVGLVRTPYPFPFYSLDLAWLMWPPASFTADCFIERFHVRTFHNRTINRLLRVS